MTNLTLKVWPLLCLIFMIPSGTYAQSGKDAKTAIPICELKTYSIDNMKGFGTEELQYYNLDCFSSSFKESNSHWMTMDVDNPGTLTFLISPNDINADIDFVVFKNVGGEKMNLIPIRCMGSGLSQKSKNPINNRNLSKPCTGSTGLSINSLDDFELTGCNYNDDNFLKYLRCRRGDQIYIMINNHTDGSGVDIHFDGDATLSPLDECSNQIIANSISELILYPNPSSALLNVALTLEKPSVLDIDILDFSGKRIKQFSRQGKSGHNQFELIIKDLVPGSYILTTQQDDHPVYRQFVKI